MNARKLAFCSAVDFLSIRLPGRPMIISHCFLEASKDQMTLKACLFELLKDHMITDTIAVTLLKGAFSLTRLCVNTLEV